VRDEQHLPAALVAKLRKNFKWIARHASIVSPTAR
jgi:hypothetical protein